MSGLRRDDAYSRRGYERAEHGPSREPGDTRNENARPQDMPLDERGFMNNLVSARWMLFSQRGSAE